MELCTSTLELSECLGAIRKQGKPIGFIPTMGALHDGHISLIKKAEKDGTIPVMSIFVNPTQFNNPDDLTKYPRNLDADLTMIEKYSDCKLVFAPQSVEQVYNSDYTPAKLNLHGLDTVMEGAFRPGHFDGVVNVVNQLFKLFSPNKAYFGEKDFQQLAIIRYMAKALGHHTEIIGCPIIREANGLARSSRNEQLCSDMRQKASILYSALLELKSNYLKYTLKSSITIFKEQIKSGGLDLEYIQIVDGLSLTEMESWHNASYTQACVAAYAGDVRLIDNLRIFS